MLSTTLSCLTYDDLVFWKDSFIESYLENPLMKKCLVQIPSRFHKIYHKLISIYYYIYYHMISHILSQTDIQNWGSPGLMVGFRLYSEKVIIDIWMDSNWWMDDRQMQSSNSIWPILQAMGPYPIKKSFLVIYLYITVLIKANKLKKSQCIGNRSFNS